MKVLTVIALLFAVSALPAQASVIQWTYKANPLTLVGPPQPWDSLVEPNPYDGVTLSISSELLDFSGGAVSAGYGYNVVSGQILSACDPAGTLGRIEGCLTVRPETGSEKTFIAAGSSSGVFVDGSSRFVFRLSGGSGPLYATYGGISAVVQTDLSIKAEFGLMYNPQGPQILVGGDQESFFGCESGTDCPFVPSFDRSKFPANNPLLSPVAQYTAPGGTWVLAAVPLPGSIYGLIVSLGALAMLGRVRTRRRVG